MPSYFLDLLKSHTAEIIDYSKSNLNTASERGTHSFVQYWWQTTTPVMCLVTRQHKCWIMQTNILEKFWRKKKNTTAHNKIIYFFLYFCSYFSLFPCHLCFSHYMVRVTCYIVLKTRTAIQNLHLVASKVWIQLLKIKVYIFTPYFTDKIKTLFFGPLQKWGL